MEKEELYIPFNMMPEGRMWKVGQTYRVKLVVKQTSVNEDGAEFEIVDATSLEPVDKRNRVYMTEGGYIKL